MTSNENIADNGGLVAAFNGFQMLKQKTSYSKHLFNDLKQFNDDQLFFIHYAYVSYVSIINLFKKIYFWTKNI